MVNETWRETETWLAFGSGRVVDSMDVLLPRGLSGPEIAWCWWTPDGELDR